MARTLHELIQKGVLALLVYFSVEGGKFLAARDQVVAFDDYRVLVPFFRKPISCIVLVDQQPFRKSIKISIVQHLMEHVGILFPGVLADSVGRLMELPYRVISLEILFL